MELSAGAELQGGKYRIERVLGSGGFGTTYKATQIVATRPALETRTVVIKEYFPREIARRDPSTSGLIIADPNRSSFDSGLKKFVREGRILLDVSHPNIIRVFELFEEGDTAYLVMEYIPGGDLANVLTESGGCLDEARTRRVMDGIVSALDALHRYAPSIFHLDLKPQNVMLRADGRPILIDFGAARLDQSQTRTSLALTLNYAPPELLSHGQPGPESDIYELGVLLHVLLTGETPPNAMARSQPGGESEWKPALAEPWATVIARALDLRRETRPTDVRAWWGHAASPDAHLRRRSTDHESPGQPRRRNSDRPSADTPRLLTPLPVPTRQAPPVAWVSLGAALITLGGVGSSLLNPLRGAEAAPRPVAASVASATSAPSLEATEQLAAVLARVRSTHTISGADEAAIRTAVGRGAAVNARTEGSGETALHLAVALDAPALVDFLLARKADTAAKDAEGGTPLHTATVNNRPQMIEKLLDAGAQRDSRDGAGRTPLERATTLNHREAVDTLRTYR